MLNIKIKYLNIKYLNKYFHTVKIVVGDHINLKKNDFVTGHLPFPLFGKYFYLVAPYSGCEA